MKGEMVMALVSVRCPGCGAGAEFVHGTGRCFCEYCGTELLLRETGSVPTVQSLFERALIQLRDRDFGAALGLAERILDADPYCAPAYMARFCARSKVRRITDLAFIYFVRIAASGDVRNAVSFAEGRVAETYEGIVAENERRCSAHVANVELRQALKLERNRLIVSLLPVKGPGRREIMEYNRRIMERVQEVDSAIMMITADEEKLRADYFGALNG